MEPDRDQRWRRPLLRHAELASTTPRRERVALAPDRWIAIARVGQGPPRILFDAGAFGLHVDGANVLAALGRRGVAAASYTRAGLYGSGPLPQGAEPSPTRQAADMVRLLDAVGAEAPVVLIGHSIASLRLLAFAALVPERVAGLVFVDAVIPGGAARKAVLRSFTALCATVPPLLPVLAPYADAYPNALRLGGRDRADKLSSVTSKAHWLASRRELRAAARAAWPKWPAVPMVFMPASPISVGSEEAARLPGGRLVDMHRWGHASVLSPEPGEAIAAAAIALFQEGPATAPGSNPSS